MVSGILKGQILIDNTLSPQLLIEEVLVNNGVSITGVEFQGVQSAQLAKFTDNNSNFGFLEGIFMSTGWVTAINSNSTILADFEVNFGSNDMDIATLSRNDITDIHDAVVLEFDFVPNGDSVSFKYVFASEEYPDYVCSEFNDAFGFFLSGPGINGNFTDNAINIATIPNSTTFVSIGTVNSGFQGIFPNPIATCNLNNSQYYVNNNLDLNLPFITPKPVVYNAWTVVLEAKAAVQCGQEYHIKLAIADVIDGNFDSGVFLEANSFNSTNIDLGVAGVAIDANTNIAYEGCSIDLTFSRPQDDLGDTTNIPLSWDGTAIPNTDYSDFPDSLLFLPGEDTVTYTLNITLDNQPESPEIIEINLLTTECSGSGFTFEVYIADPPPVIIGISDTVLVACEDSVQLNALVDGGTGNLIYNWETSLNNSISNNASTPWLNAADQGEYLIEVIDTCSQDTARKIVVFLQAIIQGEVDFSISNNVFCAGESLVISNNSNNLNEFFWTFSDGFISNDLVPSYEPFNSGVLTIELIGGDSNACYISDTAELDILVNDSAFANFNVQIYCPNTTYTLSSIDQTTGNSYSWASNNGLTGNQSTFDINFAAQGNYQITLQVTNSSGCTDAVTKDVVAGIPVNVEASFSLFSNRFCNNSNVNPINQSVNATDYIWYDGNGQIYTDFQPQFSYQDTGYYDISLVASSSLSCSGADSSTITIHVETAEANFSTDTLCQDDSYQFNSLNNENIVSWTWSIDQVSSSTLNPFTTAISTSGNHTISLTVTSDIGCSDTQSKNVYVVERPISNFINEPACVGQFTSFENQSVGELTSVLWDFGDGQTTTAINPNHIFWSEGDFVVSLSSFADHCPADVYTETITTFHVPDLSLGDDLLLCQGEIVKIGLPDSVTSELESIIWSTGSSGDSILVSLDYPIVQVTGYINVCNKSDILEIMEECPVSAPTAFSPNGDGFNDEFNIIDNNVASFNLTIYNRWGEMVYNSSSFQNGWDGIYKNNQAPMDLYTFIVKGVKIDGIEFSQSGSFVLIR